MHSGIFTLLSKKLVFALFGKVAFGTPGSNYSIYSILATPLPKTICVSETARK